MSLISLEFFLFVALSVVVYYLAPKKMRWIVLLTANYIFYISSSKFLAIFLILSTLSIYIVGLLLEKQNKFQKETIKTLEKEEKKAFKKKIKQRKQWIVIAGILINFGILLYLKYYNFFGGNFNALFHLFQLDIQIPAKKFILPLGISYYTLQAVSYIIDVYRGKYPASKHLGKVALFLSFFPQMTEGPIGRFDLLADQLYLPNKYNTENIKTGLYLILWGLFKKLVIADRAAIFVNTVFGTTAGGFTAFLAVALYTLQIYAEFSGAMDIVQGVAHLFGVKLAKNFERPFFSKSIAEFWRRWHITLGTWLKDYVFYSVSLSKMNMNLNKSVKTHIKGNLGKFILTAFPLFFVWFFNGFWHGATWKFILYGLYYYIIMMIGTLLAPYCEPIKKKLHLSLDNKGYQLFSVLRTCLIVFGGMLLFRSHDTTTAIDMFMRMFTINDWNVLIYGLSAIDFVVLIIGVLVLFFSSWFMEKGVDFYFLIDKKSQFIRYTVLFLAIMAIIIFGIYGKGYNASDFIYGEF